MNRTGTYANQPNAVAAAEEAVRAGRVAVVLVVPVDHNNPGCGLGYEVWESQGYNQRIRGRLDDAGKHERGLRRCPVSTIKPAPQTPCEWPRQENGWKLCGAPATERIVVGTIAGPFFINGCATCAHEAKAGSR